MKRNRKYVLRLIKEWREHGKIIIGVDYDSTISPYHTIDNSEDILKTIKLLKVAISVANYIVLLAILLLVLLTDNYFLTTMKYILLIVKI